MIKQQQRNISNNITACGWVNASLDVAYPYCRAFPLVQHSKLNSRHVCNQWKNGSSFCLLAVTRGKRRGGGGGGGGGGGAHHIVSHILHLAHLFLASNVPFQFLQMMDYKTFRLHSNKQPPVAVDKHSVCSVPNAHSPIELRLCVMRRERRPIRATAVAASVPA